VSAHSFSGAHPFNPAHLVEAWLDSSDAEADGNRDDYRFEAVEDVAQLVELIDHGRCPRCARPMEMEFPAGSRVTNCRCIPVCWECGNCEPYTFIALDMVKGKEDGVLCALLVPVCSWPDFKNTEQQALALAEIELRTTRGVPFTEVAIGALEIPQHPGGWAEFGHDDTQDQAERAS
jgi:hypothetical protein